jgi:hypothetical protein
MGVLAAVVGGGAAYVFAHGVILTTVISLLIMVAVAASTTRTPVVLAAMAGWVLVTGAIALPMLVNRDPGVRYASGSGLFFAVALLVGPLALGAMHMFRRASEAAA